MTSKNLHEYLTVCKTEQVTIRFMFQNCMICEYIRLFWKRKTNRRSEIISGRKISVLNTYFIMRKYISRDQRCVESAIDSYVFSPLDAPVDVSKP